MKNLVPQLNKLRTFELPNSNMLPVSTILDISIIAEHSETALIDSIYREYKCYSSSGEKVEVFVKNGKLFWMLMIE